MRHLFFCLMILLGSAQAHANELVLGQTAPVLVLHTTDGQEIKTSDLLGQVVIVTFWASYCEMCRAELPVLSAYSVQQTQHGLRILGFSLDGPGELEQVKQIARTVNFPTGLLGNPYAGGYGRIWRMPVSFVIDRRGRLAYNGWNDAQPVLNMARLHSIVDPLLTQ